MSFVDDLRADVYGIRAIPSEFGVRPYTVVLESKQWTGAERGEGVAATTTTEITEADDAPPKVRWLSNEELAIGGYELGSVEVGPITPMNSAGGTALTTLIDTPGTTGTHRFILTGPRFPSGASFRLKGVTHDRGYHYKVVLEPIGQ